jgi:hypothetical protein
VTDADYLHGMTAMRQWLLEHGDHADDCHDETVITYMLPQLCMAVAQLGRCTFQPGSWDKRFVRSVTGAEVLTPRQAITIFLLRHRYRRQIKPTRHDFRIPNSRGRMLQETPKT